MQRSRDLRALRGPATAILVAMSPMAPAAAQDAVEPEAADVLAGMQAYLAGLPRFTAAYEVDLDIITEDGEKLKFASAGELTAQRPDRLRVTRLGAGIDAEIVLNADGMTIFGHGIDSYYRFPAATIDEAIDGLRDETGFDAPGADLLSSTPLDASATDIVSGVHVGMAYPDGVESHHLAFRGKTVDWQLWIKAGEEPVPLRYVITSKWLTGAPEYALRLRDWNVAPEFAADVFAFTPPASARVLDSISADEIGHLVGQKD